MIGRDAAIAEVGEHRHELEGVAAYSMWLGVHIALLNGLRVKSPHFRGLGLELLVPGARTNVARPFRRRPYRLAWR